MAAASSSAVEHPHYFPLGPAISLSLSLSPKRSSGSINGRPASTSDPDPAALAAAASTSDPEPLLCEPPPSHSSRLELCSPQPPICLPPADLSPPPWKAPPAATTFGSVPSELTWPPQVSLRPPPRLPPQAPTELHLPLVGCPAPPHSDPKGSKPASYSGRLEPHWPPSTELLELSHASSTSLP